MSQPSPSPSERPGAGSPGDRPRAPWVLRLLLVAASLLVGLVLAEVAVRVTGAAPEVVAVRAGRFRLSPNPKIGYEPVPDFEHHGALDSFYDYRGRSNGLGFRDVEHPVEKPSGTFRILVLGDSVAAGQGVARFEDTFPPLLEEDLRRGGLPAEVLSFAVTGYNTQQEVETLADKGLAFQPDLVLLAYCLNDVKRSDGGVLPGLLERERRTAGPLRHRVNPVLVKSALYRLLWYRLAAPRPEPTPTIVGNTVAESFDHLGLLARQSSFEVLVVVFPRFGKLLEEYRYAEEHRLPAEGARRNGFDYLDLVAAFQECRRTARGPLAHDRYHPTARGHRCAARAVAERLLNHRGPAGAS